MKKIALSVSLVSLLMGLNSCSNNNQDANSTTTNITAQSEQKSTNTSSTTSNVSSKDINEYIPNGYRLLEAYKEDLNKDNSADQVLLVKATDASKISGEEDKNRRGLIILLSNGNQYDVAIKNLTCFSSEFEDGGISYPPELSVEAKKGLVYISYGHGQYGIRQYTFRYQNNDFELIGFDREEMRAGLTIAKTSINFSTGKMITSEIIDENVSIGQEKFKDKTSTINKKPMVKLSQVKDFDELVVD